MAVLAGAMILLPRPGPVAAGNFTGPNGATTNCSSGSNLDAVNGHDGHEHTFYHSALEPGTWNAVEWARRNRIEPTSINTIRTSSVTSATDVVSYDQDYSTYCFRWWHPSGPTIGLTTCVSLAGSACEKHEVRYDLSFMNAVDQNGRNILACHETGHTIGLLHRGTQASQNGCMANPYPHAGEWTLHDVEHINGAGWIKPDSSGSAYVRNGQRMTSYDGRYALVVQGDGNVVVYGPPGGPCNASGVCWASHTNWAGNSVFAVIQSDGNFVIYRNVGGLTPLCSSRTNGHPGSTLELQNDGNLVVYFPGHVPGEWSESSGGLCA